MLETVAVETLEQFKDPQYDCLYWISDDSMGRSLVQSYIEQEIPFGLEVGFGFQPTRVFLLDNSIDWFLTETNRMRFIGAKREKFMDDLPTPLMSEDKRIFALNLWASGQMAEAAEVILFRNFNYNSMQRLVPTCEDLRKNQRLVLVVDGMHVGERDKYKEVLVRKGYDPNKLVQRSDNLLPLSESFLRNYRAFVFDITKS